MKQPTRRRFYVQAENNGGFRIISLKYKPNNGTYEFNSRVVYGPFRTFDSAVNHLEALCGVCPVEMYSTEASKPYKVSAIAR